MLEQWKQYIDTMFPDDSRLKVVVFREFFYNLVAFILNNSGTGGGGTSEAVLYTNQNLNNQQKTIARNNIGAVNNTPNGFTPLLGLNNIINIEYLPESQYGPVPDFSNQLNNQVNF